MVSATIKSRKALLLLSAYLLSILAGCATTEHRTQAIEKDTGTPVWPPSPQIPRIRYVGHIASPEDIGVRKSWLKQAFDTLFGKEDIAGILLRPYSVFINGEMLYVTDPGAHILHIFNMKKQRYFTIKDAKGAEFISPIAVAADDDGTIYLTDSMLKRVFVLNQEGKYVRDIGSPELFIRPTGLAIDKDRIYVVDTHNHCVSVFEKREGKLIFTFGKNGSGEGDFNYPTHIWRDKKGLLYITDSMNFRVQIFDRDGIFISGFGKLGDGSGDFARPKGVAVDSEGHIYVVDAQFDTVQIFNATGRLLLNFGRVGRGIGEMFLPAGIFIDEHDRIFVADSYNHRIQIFQYLKEERNQ